MDDVLKLPQKLDVAGARSLLENLLSRRGHPLVVDAGGIERISTPGVEVLLSAALQWRIDGLSFRILEASEAFRDACRDLGLDPARHFDATPMDEGDAR